jgi:hypothetical protein
MCSASPCVERVAIQDCGWQVISAGGSQPRSLKAEMSRGAELLEHRSLWHVGRYRPPNPPSRMFLACNGRKRPLHIHRDKNRSPESNREQSVAKRWAKSSGAATIGAVHVSPMAVIISARGRQIFSGCSGSPMYQFEGTCLTFKVQNKVLNLLCLRLLMEFK